MQTLNDAQYYSQGIIAKHENTIVIAFRVTASFTDVLADLSIAMIPYPDHRAHLPCIRSKVHYRSYRALTSVLGSIHETLDELLATGTYEIYVKDHSFWGSLAILAAINISQKYGISPHVYTFTAPKTGNKYFRKYYNSCIKDSYLVINDVDIAP